MPEKTIWWLQEMQAEHSAASAAPAAAGVTTAAAAHSAVRSGAAGAALHPGVLHPGALHLQQTSLGAAAARQQVLHECELEYRQWAAAQQQEVTATRTLINSTGRSERTLACVVPFMYCGDK